MSFAGLKEMIMITEWRSVFLSVVLSIVASSAWGEHIAQHKNANGIDVYYGVVPAQVVQAHIDEHGAQPMHKKSPFSKGAHHLVVTLYDAKTSQRISDAVVNATVTPLGLGAESKNLEIMKVADAVSYGNYFSMPPGDTSYQITLSIKRPADHLPTKIQFEYRHAASR
jgi:hypothetical protein